MTLAIPVTHRIELIVIPQRQNGQTIAAQPQNIEFNEKRNANVMPLIDGTSLQLDGTVPRLPIDAGGDPFGNGNPGACPVFSEQAIASCELATK